MKNALPTTFFCMALVNAGGNAIKDPSEWIRYVDQQIRGEQSDGKFQMQITTPDWQRTLELNAKVLGKDKSIIFIKSPAKEKGIGTLRLKNRITNYFPKLKRTVNVAPSMLLSRWMGSDFTNDDLLKASSFVDDYQHSFIKTKKSDEFRIVESTIKTDSKAIWPKIHFYLSPKDCLPRKEVFFDNKGAPVRTLTLSQIKKFGTHLVPSTWEMKYENAEGKSTKLIYLDINYNSKLSEDDFTIKNLSH